MVGCIAMKLRRNSQIHIIWHKNLRIRLILIIRKKILLIIKKFNKILGKNPSFNEYSCKKLTKYFSIFFFVSEHSEHLFFLEKSLHYLAAGGFDLPPSLADESSNNAIFFYVLPEFNHRTSLVFVVRAQIFIFFFNLSKAIES